MRKEIIPVDHIAPRIRQLRSEKVLLDYDLAALYRIETRALKQAVRRNLNRFPPDFMFELSAEEIETVVSQFVIPDRRKFGGAQPMAFTEQGVAMVNIAIMCAFVKLRGMLESNRELARKFAELERRAGKHDEEIGAILEAIRQLMTPPLKPRREIGFHVREKAPRYRARKRA
jgi:hypothetical protein